MPPTLEAGSYSSNEYWDQEYRQNGGIEWYSNCNPARDLLPFILRPSDRILNIGCGNSTQSAELYDAGYHNIINNDVSPTVIERMRTANSEREEMQWECMDVFTMAEGAERMTDVPVTRPPFPRRSFDVVVDKGTMDAIACGGAENTCAMVRNISRLLPVGGRYVMFTTDDRNKRFMCDPEVAKGIHFSVEDKTSTLKRRNPNKERGSCRAFVFTKEAPDDNRVVLSLRENQKSSKQK